MQKVAVCVATYNRPEGLRALLASLDRQSAGEPHGGVEIVIAVIDNSADGGARGICQDYAAYGRFPLIYGREPRRGLAFARNASLAAARDLQATHAAFIDDDEAAPPEWLARLLRRLEETRSAAVIGPVYPIFAASPPAWLPVEAYVIRPRVSHGFALEGYTCNSLASMAAIEAAGAGFDERFNETGGEDTMFFKALTARSGKALAFAEEAFVHEFVPHGRMTRAWLWRRWYRTGNVEALIGHPAPESLKGRLANIGKGGARIAAGAAKAAAGLARSVHRPDAFTASCYTACRGAGFIAGAFGARYKEYSRPAYR